MNDDPEVWIGKQGPSSRMDGAPRCAAKTQVIRGRNSSYQGGGQCKKSAQPGSMFCRSHRGTV